MRLTSLAHVGVFAGMFVGAGELIASGVGVGEIVFTKKRDRQGEDGTPAVAFKTLGLFSGALSTIHFVSLFKRSYPAAKVLSFFALIPSVLQLGAGIFSNEANKEGGISGKEIALVAVQTGMLLFGLRYATRSLPALVAAARREVRGSLVAIQSRGLAGDKEATQMLGSLAIERPDHFVAYGPAVPFSPPISESISRTVIEEALRGTKLPEVSQRGLFLINAIALRPHLFREADIPGVLQILRETHNGPQALASLIAGRSSLAETVIESAPMVLHGKDWDRFGDPLRVVWSRLLPIPKGRIISSWSGLLTRGGANRARPTRDLFRLLEKDRYEAFVERHVQEGIVSLVKDKRLPAEYERLATPVLEDVMISSSHLAGTTSLMNKVGSIASSRIDFDIGAFDFLFREYHGPTLLRKTALRLLARVGRNPRIERGGMRIHDYDDEISVVTGGLHMDVHGESRILGHAGLFDGWFGDAERTLQHQRELLEVLEEKDFYGNHVLRAIASYHHLRLS